MLLLKWRAFKAVQKAGWGGMGRRALAKVGAGFRGEGLRAPEGKSALRALLSSATLLSLLSAIQLCYFTLLKYFRGECLSDLLFSVVLLLPP